MVIDAAWCSNPLFQTTHPTGSTFSSFTTTEPTRPPPGCLPRTPAFGFSPASAPENHNVFGISSFPYTKQFPGGGFCLDTQLKPGTGSRSVPYSPSPEPDEVYGGKRFLQSISAMPAYKTKSHEELRWEDYELFPDNKFCGSKNCDTLCSQIGALHSQFETLCSQFQTLCSQFETFKPNCNLFGPKTNSAPSPFYQTQEPKKNPFGPNSTPFAPPGVFFHTQAFNTTNEPFKPNNKPFGPNSTPFLPPSPFPLSQDEPFKPNNNTFAPLHTPFPPRSPFSHSQSFNTTNEPFKPNNNPFGPNSTPFPPPSPFPYSQDEPFKPNNNTFAPLHTPFPPRSPFSHSQSFYTTNEPFKPNNNPFGPNSTHFSTLSPFSQSQAFNTTNETFKPNNNPFGTPCNNTSPTPSVFVLNKDHQTQPFGLPGRRFEPNSATCGANDEVFQSISAMPGYEAKSHEELRWEELRWEKYESLPNNKCCGFKNYATVRSPWSLLPNNKLFGHPSKSTTSATSSTSWRGENPFFLHPTHTSPAPFTFEPKNPNNNNLFAPTKNNSTTPFPSPQFSPFSFNGPTIPPASQPAGKTGNHFFTDSFSQPSQEASTSSSKAAEVGYQNNNGQQHQGVQFSSNTRIAPPQQSPSSELKVAFSRDEKDRSGPFVPCKNPNDWAANSLSSLHSSSNGKVCEDKDFPTTFSFQLNIQEAEHLSVTSESHEADVLSILPRLPDGGGYYTVPSLNELSAKETAEPGSLSRVKEFVVGRFGNGSIKFLGETDVRDLDLGSVLEINNRKVIVYADSKTKPAVGKGMNKAAEVSLLNLKCLSKKTGKQYVDGPQVQSYKEMLIKKGSELGAEFVSYDPVQGEWKFRVQHF